MLDVVHRRRLRRQGFDRGEMEAICGQDGSWMRRRLGGRRDVTIQALFGPAGDFMFCLVPTQGLASDGCLIIKFVIGAKVNDLIGSRGLTQGPTLYTNNLYILSFYAMMLLLSICLDYRLLEKIPDKYQIMLLNVYFNLMTNLTIYLKLYDQLF